MYPIETPNKQFVDGNGTTELGTILPAWWLNQVQAELLALLAAGGQTPVKTKHTQVRDAINKMLSDKTPLASASVAGLIKVVNVLTSDGATAALSAAQGKVLKGLIDGLGDPFKLRGALGARNLNELMGNAHFGVWHQTANASATAALNYPITKAGTLLVLPSAYQGIQLYIPFDSQHIYIRHSGGSPTVAYQPWRIIGEVVNALTSTSATAALSAAQGKILNDAKADKTEIKLSRAVVADASTPVTLDLTSRASIIAALGSRYINYGINQLNLYNNATSQITGLPINDKHPVQLDFVIMGGHSEIIANYMTQKRVFRTAINWNNETLSLTWVEQLTDRNGLKNSGNQTLEGFLDIKAASWGRIGMPTNDGGRWVMEVNPAGAADARVNFGFVKPNSGGSIYIQFPKITANEKVAYESHVAAQMATTVKTSGNQDIAGVKSFANRQAFYAGLQASNARVDFDAGRRITLGANTAEAWIKNETSGKFLALKNTGELHYDGRRVPTWGDRSDAVNLDDTNKFATARAVKTAHDKAMQAAPSGEVAYFAGINPPAGWLKANGAAVSRTTYAPLFAAIGTRYGTGDGSTTFNLPDLRGEFVRGWDDGRGVDRSRAIGSTQAQSMQSHRHGTGIMNQTDDVLWIEQKWTGNGKQYTGVEMAGEFNSYRVGKMQYDRILEFSKLPNIGAFVEGGDANKNPLWKTSGVPTHHIATAEEDIIGGETRPRNIALLACIKI